MWERYFAHISPGVKPMEEATSLAFADDFVAHKTTLRARYRDKRGMTLLHGDLNPGNILTQKTADSPDLPVYFLDRQPFDWSLTYGLALYDLAYCFAVWWPTDIFKAHETEILRCWHTTLEQPNYTWEMVETDWRLCLEQMLHVPMEWCADTETMTKMRWVWEPQLARIQAALN
jgi:thiamine kinase-like enzyme